MINQTVIQGRLCADPELRRTQSDVPVCSFRVAWSEKYKENETKLFLPCTAWRGTGEFVNKYFRKGQEIVVRGKLATREWNDTDGNKRSTIELTVEEASFCGPKASGDTGNAYSAAGSAISVPGPEPEFEELPDDDGDLPF